MPQVKDLEPLVCGGGDTKVACETQIGARPPPPRPDDNDLPPESIVVRIGSGRDLFWADVAGAAVYERDDSTKGSTNPKAQAQKQHANPNSKPRSNSQRFSGNLQAKPPIIGIPGKVQHHSGYLGRSGRRPANARIFPKKPPRSGGGGRKSAVPDEDPGSPKVSCIGKVLSERERERDRCRRQRRRSREEEEEEGGRAESAGFWARLSAVFCCGGGGRDRRVWRAAAETTTPGDAPAKAAVNRRTTAEPGIEPPGLGAMRRFASGRRPASWGGDGDGDVGVDLGTLDGEAAARGGRRSVGSLEDAEQERERETSGSASASASASV